MNYSEYLLKKQEIIDRVKAVENNTVLSVEELEQEKNNIIAEYKKYEKDFELYSLFNDDLYSEHSVELTIDDDIKETKSEINDEFWLFSQEKFNSCYPDFNQFDDADNEIGRIWKKISGVPIYKEYTISYICGVKNLFNRYPNFKEYEHFFIPNENLLKLRLDNKIRMENILIYGPPSCGKTSFAYELCDIYGDFYRTSLGTGQVNFTLMGNDKGYNRSECGDILRSMFKKKDNPIANPLVILDELDKVGYDGRRENDLSGTFSVLLEKSNSKNFVDNFFKVEVDASHINFIAIANDITNIPKHILSRFPIKIKIRNYTEREMKDVVLDNQYKKWIADSSLNPTLLPASLPEIAKDLLYECSGGHPRKVTAIFNEIASMTILNTEDKYISTFQPSEAQCSNLRRMFKVDIKEESEIGFRF